MKLFLLILGVVVVLLNLVLWYSKKQRNAKMPDSSQTVSDTHSPANDFINSPQADALKQAAANELGISVEQLNRMSTHEIAHLASEKGLV